MFGIDPQVVGEAAGAFLESPEGVDASEGELETFTVAEEVASFSREINAPMAAPPAAAPMASSMAAPPDDPEATLTRTLARHSGFNRAARSQTTLSRARILWIDDHPKWVAKPAETLRRLGARVTIVRTTQDGIRALGRVPGPDSRPFDVILSDIARGSRMDAGIRALPQLRQLAPDTPVIFFVGKLDRSLGVPKGAAGITNRTNELLHLVMDALEGR
ncbi:MAG: response regulator [Gemmatimonadetes bacterium]|nr:response regulator [Gemmatimonadota bacterium]